MTPSEKLKHRLSNAEPILALAPMQDVTNLAFLRLMTEHGGSDIYVTEYFRVYPESRLEKPILRSVTENPTGKPLLAQMIGSDIPSLVRTSHELMRHPIAAIDLNLGCPAPVVYKKCAGGGLLREPARIDAILGALREAVPIPLTVKTRIGFDNPNVFKDLLPLFEKHKIDLLSVHGRTVVEGYRSSVHYDYIRRAVETLPCPVLANGNVYSAAKAMKVLSDTAAAGLMIGRGAIRNPWLFRQIRENQRGGMQFIPTGRNVLEYINKLYKTVSSPVFQEQSHITRMKKFMNYIGIGIEPTGDFLHRIRRAKTKVEFFDICEDHLNHDDPMALEPFDLTLKPQDILAGQHR